MLDFSGPTTAHGPAAATGRRPRSRRARALVAGAVLAVLAVGATACSPHEPGSAAVVGDRQISNQQVDDAVTGIEKGNPQLSQTPDLARTVLFYLMIEPWVTTAAQQNGAGVSDDQAKAMLSATRNPDPEAVAVIRTFLALQKLSSNTQVLSQLQKDIVAEHPRVNPRYGQFNGKTMNVDDLTPNWLPKPKPTPTQTAPAP